MQSSVTVAKLVIGLTPEVIEMIKDTQMLMKERETTVTVKRVDTAWPSYLEQFQC